MNCGGKKPGPQEYSLPSTVGYEKHDPTRYRNPAYSLGLRTNVTSKKVNPNFCNVPAGFTRYGNCKAPSYTMRAKPKGLVIHRTPGPGDHKPEDCPPLGKRPPAYSMQERHPRKVKDDSPSPNIYKIPGCLGPKIPDKWAAPAATLTGRNKTMSHGLSPSPCEYPVTPLDKYKNRPPSFMIGGRNAMTKKDMPNNGPKYDGSYRKKNVPSFSFGQKHTECKTPCITPADNQPVARHVRCEVAQPQPAPYC